MHEKISNREKFFLLFFHKQVFCLFAPKIFFFFFLSLGAPSLPPQPDTSVAKFF